ncbi:MAG: cyclic nucleotide-binding domain-containing protein [Blautia sp.]|nr:cyclic nucleotide-binding domain-containing protein [Blautia sp.]
MYNTQFFGQQNGMWAQSWPQQNYSSWLQQNYSGQQYYGRNIQNWQQPQSVSHLPGQQPAANKTLKPAANAASKPAKSTAKGLTPGTFTASDLTQESLDAIITKYGIDIEDIFNLAPGQEWMFGRAKKVTNAFFLQMYMKLNMELKPSEFRQKVDEVSLKRTNLRTAFAYRGLKKPYQVVLKNRRPELNFIDRSDMSEEELEEEISLFRENDRRRGFDLEKDPLLRITVFSTAEKDTYAIVMSQPHINDDGVSEGLIMKDIFIDYALGGKFPMPEMAAGSYQSYAKWIENIDKEAELKYWEELLKGARISRLPGRVTSNLDPMMNTRILSFSEEEKELIGGMQRRYQATMNSIVQTAWGVMLQKIYKRDDAVFGCITSGRSAEVSDNDMMTGSFVNAFPVRVRAEEDKPFKALVAEIQTQILISQNKAHCTPDEIREKLGREGPVFDHLLNFHNFGGGSHKRMPALPGFSILEMDFFDNLSTGFCLYFQMPGKDLICRFTYDSRAFSDRKIRVLMDCYRKVLTQVIRDTEGTLTVGDISCPTLTCFLDSEDDEALETEKKASLFKGMPLFQGIDETSLWKLAEKAKILSFTGGEVIIRERSLPDGLYAIAEGYVEEFRTAANGWQNTLRAVGPGGIIGASGTLDNVRTYSGVNAISEEVKIVHITKADVVEFMNEQPQFARSLIRELHELVKRYSMLWVNSDY